MRVHQQLKGKKMLNTHSEEWHEERRKVIGGSDANTIMNGTREQRYELWQLKCGLRKPDELADVFPVQLGSFTEPFNLFWFSQKTGLVLDGEQNKLRHANGWMSCTPDALTTLPNGDRAVVEAKHTHGQATMVECLNRYQPQLHHNMICAGFKRAFLSVIIGNSYDYVEVEFDELYAAELLKAEHEFWECVQMGMPPSDALPEVEPPPAWKVVDMTGNNQWADLCAEWTATREFSKRFDKAAAELKRLVPLDVKTAKGHGIVASRNKRGALTLSEEK